MVNHETENCWNGNAKPHRRSSDYFQQETKESRCGCWQCTHGKDEGDFKGARKEFQKCWGRYKNLTPILHHTHNV